MALFFDPANVVFSPNAIALGFITNFQGSFTFENQTIGGFNVAKVTYHKSSNTFGATRIEAIANTLSNRIFLSQKGPEFVLPDGTKLKEVAGAVLVDPVGQILVWDTSNCDGAGYHVFDTGGDPIVQEMYLTVFHELSHAYHNAIGTNLPDFAAMEALAINETNLLRAELGITEQRDPTNHNGGCGPGPQKPWWTDFLIDFEGVFKVFLERAPSPPPGTPSPDRIGELIENGLDRTAGFSSAATRSNPAFRNHVERPLLRRVGAFYRTAALVLDPGTPPDALLAELALELARSPDSGPPPAQLPPFSTPPDVVTVFLAEPDRIISEAHAAARTGRVTVSEIAMAFRKSVMEWYESARHCRFEEAAGDEPYHSDLGTGATLRDPPPRGRGDPRRAGS